MCRGTWVCLVAAVFAASASAAPIVVDGGVSDWGVTVADDNGSSINSYVGYGGIGLLGWMSEDQDDGAGSDGYVGPNRGGQNYDAEFMAVAEQGGMLYVVVVSGQRPDNGFSTFGPGDLRIIAPNGTFGIEFGGGEGGSGITTPLLAAGAGATYALNGSGSTTGYTALETPDLRTAGSVWHEPQWINDPLDPEDPAQIDHQFTGGAYVGHAAYYYTRNDFTDQHSVIELALPMSFLGTADHLSALGFFWSPSCGNDLLSLSLEVHPAPEPGSLVLLTVGGLALAGAVRRRRRRSRKQ